MVSLLEVTSPHANVVGVAGRAILVIAANLSVFLGTQDLSVAGIREVDDLVCCCLHELAGVGDLGLRDLTQPGEIDQLKRCEASTALLVVDLTDALGK